MRLSRPGWWVAAPALLVAAWTIVPLATGARTLVLRDVLNTHLALRAGPAEAIRKLELPLVDPLRGGGQPALGNPNAVLLYPDNLLLFVGSTLWQLNAHFWIHWLVAGLAMGWLGRRWGLDDGAAAVAGVAYASSGYVLSQLNLYNAVAAAALAPAFAAALLGAGERPTNGRRAAIAGGLWALLLLGGDPTLALLAAILAVVPALARHGRRCASWRLALALAAGSLVALPQIVETARIWGESFRAIAPGSAGGGVRDPVTLLDLVFPLVFGRPDASRLWANGLFGGFPALYFSLAPGTVVLLMAAGAGRPRRRVAWALALMALVGAILLYAGATPAGRALVAALGGGFRYTDKLALWPAVALSLAAGAGAAALGRDGAAQRRVVRAGLVLAGLAGAISLLLALDVAALGRLVAFLVPRDGAAAVLELERVRWGWIAATVAATSAVAVGVTSIRGLPRTARLALFAGLQAASQLVLLAPLLLTDEAARYRQPSPLIAEVGRGGVVVQGGYAGLFGHADPVPDANDPPGAGYLKLHRQAHLELWGGTTRLSQIRTDLDPSAERLSHFTLPAAAQWMKSASDRERVAMLAALGVDTLFVPAPLAAESGARGGRRVALPPPGRAQWIYEIRGAIPEASLLGEIVGAEDTRSAIEALTSPGFEPTRTAVVAGRRDVATGPPGQVEWLERGPERARLRVESPAGGVLVLRRSYLPIWRVEIDGEPGRTTIAQFSRLAVRLPPGAHEVRFWVPRAPLRAALAGSAVGGLLLLLLAWRRARGRSPIADAPVIVGSRSGLDSRPAGEPPGSP